MGKTAVGLYETSAEAQRVLSDLLQAGFSRTNIRIMLGDQSTRKLHEWYEDQPSQGNDGRSQWADGGASAVLTSMGVPRSDAQDYEEALHRGHALVSVSTTEERIDEAVGIMSRHEMVNLQERTRDWKSTASTAAASTAASMKSTTGTERNLKSGEEATLPVIEEELHVGKREVESGGVRVKSRVTETPVEETVNLREEHVHVERRPVDRAVNAADRDLLRDQTIEVNERSEEAIVNKEARVVEEVVVRKDVETRQEHIKDTVRRTDVEVEKLSGESIQGWDRFNNDFRTHYQSTFGTSGHDFTYYEPAYRYGYGLASRPDWRGRSWTQIEPEARRQWESEYRDQGPWEDFKDAVQHAWMRITR